MTESEARGVLGGAIDASARVLKTLPGQFLALLVINACFIGGLLWFLADQSDARERIIHSIVTSCLDGRAR